MSARPVIGFIGLGDLGLPMARRLLDKGCDVLAWNRSSGPLAALVASGARPAANPAEVGERAALVGLCLSSHTVVEQVAWGEHGLLSQITPGSRVCVADFSTGAPASTRDFAERAASRGVGWVDSPVSGGPPAAATGKLAIFAGGEARDVDALSPLFEPLARQVTHMGPSGSGQTTKICNQMIVATNLLLIAESMSVARRAGLDPNRLPHAFAGGFADSAPLQLFGPRMASRSFHPRLGALSHMLKDIELSAQLAEGVGALHPLSALTASLYRDAVNLTGGCEDLSRLIDLFEPSP